MIHGILIDPISCGCEVVELKGEQAVYDAIGCDLVGQVQMQLPNDDVLLVDEEGLFKEGLRSFMIAGWLYPLFGRGLLLGEDWEAPRTPYLELINLISFTPQFEIGPS